MRKRSIAELNQRTDLTLKIEIGGRILGGASDSQDSVARADVAEAEVDFRPTVVDGDAERWHFSIKQGAGNLRGRYVDLWCHQVV
ncbi:MAG: hypothetical protein WAZ14_02935 [Patescibacteria group bacterium]